LTVLLVVLRINGFSKIKIEKNKKKRKRRKLKIKKKKRFNEYFDNQVRI
jgi:hypothetical protein